MGTSSSKVPQYEIVDSQQQASSSSNPPRQQSGSFSPSSEGLLNQPSSSNSQQWAPVRQASPPPLPQGWDFHTDPGSGYPYFYNTFTSVSQWQDPRGPGLALPDRSDATHLGQRRQVIPPWEGGPADVDPLSWPLPPGWQEQQDHASNQRYFVNYDAHILSYKDPRVEIAKAYAQGPTVEGVPVNYPPPVMGGPGHEEPKPVEFVPFGPPPPVRSGTQGGTSYLPPPPPFFKDKKQSLWSKLGYRHGRGGAGLLAGASAIYLRGVDDGSDSSSTLSSDTDDDNNNPAESDLEAGSDPRDFDLGGDLGGGGTSGNQGFQTDWRAMHKYGHFTLPGGHPGDFSSSENVGDGGNVSEVNQQSLFGFWQPPGKTLYFQGWSERLNPPVKGRGFWTLDRYTIIIVLTVLVGSYFGIVEALLSFLFALAGRLIVFMCKRAKKVKRQQKRSTRRFCDKVRWVFKRKDSPLVQLKTAAALQCNQIQAWCYEHFYEHPPARLRMLTEKDNASPLFSKILARPREITIVTQASADRLPALEAMAKSWGGVMCVAIHVRTQAELQEIYPILCSLHEQIEARGLCRLYICVVKEEGLQTEEKAMTALYPINAMRNIALSMATTELVFILDADFVPSFGMHDLLTSDQTTYSEILRMATVQHQMLVVAAFEGTPAKVEDLNISQITYPKRISELREQWREGLAKAFHCSHFPRGHEPTDYEGFFSLSTAKPYRVQYREYYEPYAICARKVIPPFDARFRGYGLNKISHAYHCAVKGMAFSVLPNVFVWSLPHRKSAAWAYTFGTSKDPFQKLRILGLYRRFKSEVHQLHRHQKRTVQRIHPGLNKVNVEELLLSGGLTLAV